jgi:TonB-linked SusC/RagA family outer membrane protein
MKKKGMLLCLLSAGMMWMPMTAIAATIPGSIGMTAPAPDDDQVITGTVEDALGPMIGATVKVQGTSNGALTDMNGKFQIKCKPGDILQVSYIGYTPKTVKAQQGMKIVLEEANKELGEVVVTALGIKRERKALGYSVSEIKGEELTKAKETNVVNSLAGKVAGLVVQNTAGGPSGSTHVQLRGTTEMTGNNQPLYVIDGVPLDNTNFGGGAKAEGGYDLGDGISAINPDDIENMTVLKGPAASALYGSRASHGVILITTKKADKEKISVEYNGSLTFDTQAANWDNIQQIYGQGDHGKYITSGRNATNMSWGPKADDYSHYYEFDGQYHPYSIVPNNASGFFRTGLTTQNTAIISASSGKTGMRFSFTDMRNKDILPNSGMNRDNFNLRVNTSLGKLDLDFTANYTREGVNNRPALASATTNVGKNLMTLATTFDQAWLKHYQNEDGTYADWNGLQIYNVNPYWDLYKNSNESTKNVYRFAAKAIYNINPHLKIQGTIGTDINNMDFMEYIAYSSPQEQKGKMTTQQFNNRTLNAEILAMYNNSWGDFDLNATAGGSIYKVDNKTSIALGKDEVFRDLKSISNYSQQTAHEDMYNKQINSLYGSASLGYKHTYYVDATVRGDKSSTLPSGNNIYVYPSVSGSWVFSELVPNSAKKYLTYGKLRGSFAEVGSDTDPFLLQQYYTNAKFAYSGYNIAYINGDLVPNPTLKPTRTRSFEVGTELKLFNNRLSIDFTYYNQTSRDQIIRLANSSASSYKESLVNAGKIKNEGVELAINGRALQVKDFAWDLGFNFSKNWNRVLELTEGMNYFEIEKAPWMGVSVGAEVGENFGSIKGRDFMRNEQGQILVNEVGLPMYEETTKTIGNASWDWTGGFYTTFTYKNFRLSAGFDVKVGADVFSMTMSDACYTGKDLRTLEGREEWYTSEAERIQAGKTLDQWREEGKCRGYVVDGVVASTGEKNTYAIDPQTYWDDVRTNAASMFVYDNSYVKCREITFTYSFPSKLLGNNKFVKSLDLSFVARNPFMIWKNIPNIDPDSNYSSTGMGLEYGSLPSRRSYGLNVNMKF